MMGIISSSSFNTTPKQVSGLVGWFDANDPNGDGTQPSTGTNISTWVDKSGAGNNATNGTGSQQPVFTTNLLNGKPGLVFDGGDGLLSTSLASLINGTDVACCIFSVASANSITAGNQFWWGFAKDSTPTPLYTSSTNTSGGTGFSIDKRDDGGTIKSLKAGTPVGGTTYVITQNILSGGTTVDLYVGTSKIIPAGDIDVGALTITTFSIGVRAATGIFSGPLTGKIYETIAYNKTLSATEIAVVQNYLKTKWGI